MESAETAPLTQEFYDRAEVTGSSLQAPRTKVALDLAARLEVERALDVGSGDGEVSAALAQLTGATVVCGDISEVAVRRCRDRGLEAHQIELGIQPLPFADETFDLVFMTEVLEHLVRPDQAIADVRRLLRPGGHLVLSTPNLACLPNRVLVPLGIQPLFSEVSEITVLGRVLGMFGEGGQPVGHLRLYTKRALLAFLQLQGFTPQVVRGAGFHWGGALSQIEKAVAFAPGLAMVLVVLARKGPN
jgi:2-polyprenyl-3-methyl-5-hydroxy-6-metoxy-1,4-benzoquinol methylase